MTGNAVGPQPSDPAVGDGPRRSARSPVDDGPVVCAVRTAYNVLLRREPDEPAWTEGLGAGAEGGPWIVRTEENPAARPGRGGRTWWERTSFRIPVDLTTG